MINKEEIITLLLKACPSFKTIYDQSDNKDLLYPLSGDFAHHLLTLFQRDEISEFHTVADIIERLINEGDSYTGEFAVIGVLEGIQNVWRNNGVNPENFKTYLLPSSKKFWQSLNDFWEQKVPYVGYGIDQTAGDD